MENVEKFANYTTVVQVIDEIWLQEYSKLRKELQDFFNIIAGSKYFAKIIIDSQLFEFSKYFDISFFYNIGLLLSTYKNIGSYEAIIGVCKAILGKDTVVEFSNNGKDINISSKSITTGKIITVENDFILTTENDFMLSINNRLELEKELIIILIRKFLPAGIKYNIQLNTLN